MRSYDLSKVDFELCLAKDIARFKLGDPELFVPIWASWHLSSDWLWKAWCCEGPKHVFTPLQCLGKHLKGNLLSLAQRLEGGAVDRMLVEDFAIFGTGGREMVWNNIWIHLVKMEKTIFESSGLRTSLKINLAFSELEPHQHRAARSHLALRDRTLCRDLGV